MIRRPAPGDRITAPGYPTRKAGVIVEVRPPNKRTPTRCVVHLDDAEPNAAGEPIPRIFAALDLDPEQIPARNRRASNRKA